MKSISKDKVLRWVSGQQSQGGSGGGGGSVDLAGYATQIWTEQNYVNKEFFSSLFKAYDADGNEVLPNDTETTIDNIKAMVGFWTDFYISALGTGGQQSVDLRLAQLADVNVAGVTNGQVLTYNAGMWIASTPQSGTDMATVWANLAAVDNTKQIDASHLSTALTGYATQTWVNTQINDMATQTWVGQNYLSKNDAASTYLSKTDAASTYLSIAFFNRLFKAYNGTTQVDPNDTTTTIDNIKAMFGFWTDFYISALGNGGQQSVDLRLAQLADVNVAGVTNGQVLTYNTATGKWIASTPQSGTDMATVWANLAASGNQQIDASHLSTALNGYATQTWVNTQINDMATKTYVDNTYLPLTAGSSKPITGPLFFNRSNKDYRLDANDSNDAYRHMIRLRYSVNADTNVMTATMVLNETATISQSYVAADSEGFQILTLGNNIHLNAAENMYGAIRLYGKRQTGSPDATVRYVQFVPDVITAHRTYTLPDQSGTLAMTGDITTALTGYATQTWVGQNYLSKNDAASTYLSKTDAAGLFTDLSNSGNNISITIGGTNKTLTVGYASTANRASYADRLYSDDSYQAWGQTFWSYGTPNSISGAMRSVTNIDAIAYFDTSNSRLGIGTNAPSNTLHVNGTARVSSLYIGNILITADSSGIYVSNGGLSANTYVTALGQGSQSSSIYLSQLGDVNTSGASNGQALVYRGGTWIPETISSGGGGSYLPLSGGTMTGTIVTPYNDNEGIIPAANNYGQVGSSSRYYYRMYATTYYGTTFVGDLSGTAASASALTSAGRSTLISDNNEFNFLSSSNSAYSSSLYFNYRAASGGYTSTAVAEYIFANGRGTNLAYLNSTGAHAGSDIRRKNIKEYFALAVDDIADAPVIKYTWKDIDDGLHAGSVAQYWQQVLPECVGKHGSSEYLSMNYADIALVSVISLAREVVRLRREIENLIHNKA